MTRTRNSSFGGTAPPDVDVDVPSYTSIFREIVQDANYLYDIGTGENGVSGTSIIIKNGESGRGPPLRRVVVNQEILKPSSSPEGAFRVSEADYDVYGGRCYALAIPLFVPQGETDYWIDVVMDDPFGSAPVAEVRDTSWALNQEVPLTRASLLHGEDEVYQGVVQFTAPGQYYLLIQITLGYGSGGWLHRWRVYPKRRRDGDGGILPTQSYNPFPVGNGAGETFETIHDEMIVDDYPVASWLLTTLNRNVNWLLEWFTGAPVVGNSARQLAVHMDHSQDNFTSEGELEFPLFAEAYGATQVDSNAVVIKSDGLRGCASWCPIIPLFDGTTRRTYGTIDLYVPNFPNNNLRCRVLAAQETGKGDPSKWRFRVTTGAGSATEAAFTQIGTSDFWTAECTSIPVSTYGALEYFDFELRRDDTVGTAFGEMQLLGLQLYFDP